MDMGNLMVIILGAIFINNFVLSRFLGLCPYVGVSKKLESAQGMGFAVIFVMTIASAVTWIIYNYLLSPSEHNVWYLLWGGADSGRSPDMFNLTFLRTIAFILVIATLVQFIEMVIQKISPPLYSALGIYLPLITTNCAILGVSVLNIDEGYTFIEAVINGFSAGIGFTIALLLMAGIRERLELGKVPKSLQGMPIAFIMACLMSIAFLGFSGLSLG
jgi:electron transport complex protein RnfA